MTSHPKQTTKPIEVTLPTGLFCAIRPGTLADKLGAHFDCRSADALAAVAEQVPDADADTHAKALWIACIISRLCLFDGERWSPARVLAMDSRDSDAVLDHVMPYLAGPVR
jgi:hypothetical protein